MLFALFMDRGDSLLLEEYSYPVVTGAPCCACLLVHLVRLLCLFVGAPGASAVQCALLLLLLLPPLKRSA
jgi:hypothetical protein